MAAGTAFFLALLAAAAPVHAQTLKMATLAPQGSIWDQAIRAMGERWAKETAGSVQLRIYAGGVAGDESDALRKTRAGQFQGLAITVAGLTEIDSAFNVFQIPMYFESFEELYFVLAELRPALEARLAAKGYVLLHWGHGGWIHLFSRQPIRTLDDLKQQKLFVWAGDDSAVQAWKKNGYQPVPLAATDILLGFQTKMIDVVPTTPIAALSLQWYRQTPYMLGMGLAPLVGGVVLTKSAWDKVSPADQALVLAAAKATEKGARARGPETGSERHRPDAAARALGRRDRRGGTEGLARRGAALRRRGARRPGASGDPRRGGGRDRQVPFPPGCGSAASGGAGN